MRFFDIFSCCGSRRDKLKDPEPVSYHVIRMEPRNLWLTDGVLGVLIRHQNPPLFCHLQEQSQSFQRIVLWDMVQQSNMA